MKNLATKRGLRCAIYTRVSTDQGLEQDFNSLDAQREASEAYISVSPGRTSIPSSRASSMMIAATGWGRAMRRRAGGAGDTRAALSPRSSPCCVIAWLPP